MDGSSVGLGITFQWLYGPVGGPYTTPLGNLLVQSTSGIPAGTYEVVVDVTCDAGPTTVQTTPFALTVNAVPTASAANDGPVCVGGTVNLTGTTDIGSSFAWTGPDGFSSSSQNPSISSILLSQSGTYTFTATASGCTSAEGTTEVSVTNPPIISAVTSTPEPICANDDAQLDVQAAVDLPNVLISEVVTFKTGTNGGVYPAYITDAVDDFIELNNSSSVPADVSGWSIADYALNATTSTHPELTFPPGTVIPPNGALVVGMGAGTRGDPSNLYFTMGGGNNSWSSGSVMGVILRNGSTIIDAMGRGTGFTFNAALGVTPADWTGAAPGVGGNAGTVRTALTDTNTDADWVASGSAPVTMGVFNAPYTNPNTGTISAYSWSPHHLLGRPCHRNPSASGRNSDDHLHGDRHRCTGLQGTGQRHRDRSPADLGAPRSLQQRPRTAPDSM